MTPRTPVKLTRRGRLYARILTVAVFATAFALGACAPLWDSMPWAVTP